MRKSTFLKTNLRCMKLLYKCIHKEQYFIRKFQATFLYAASDFSGEFVRGFVGKPDAGQGKVLHLLS